MQKTNIYIIIMVLSGIFAVPGCSEPQRNYQKAPPPEHSTVMEIHGNWIDLDEAVAAAAADAGMAILSSDRWNTMVMYKLVTETGQPGSLVVIGNRDDHPEATTGSTNTPDATGGEDQYQPGLCRAEARVGRLRNAQREQQLLKALKLHLQK